MLAILAFGVHLALPRLVDAAVRRELAARGFPDARFTVVSIGVGHLHLTGVWLADGLALGDLELDAGISLLWRAPTHATVRHARIAASALRARSDGGGGGAPTAWPVGALHIDDGVLELDGIAIAIEGTITRAADGVLSGDASAQVVALALGPVTARVVTLAVRGAGARDAVEVGWSATGDGLATWTAHGRGRVGWAHGELALDGGEAEVDVAATRDAPAIHTEATVAGALSTLALEVIGVARTDDYVLGDHAYGMHARDIAAPLWLALTREGFITRAPIVAEAREAEVRIGGVRVDVSGPRVELAGANTHLGSALALPSVVAWRAAHGPGGLALDDGALDIRRVPGGLQLAGGHAHALGGELVLAPARVWFGRPVALALAAHGLTVPRVLVALGRSERGTGAIDGELAIRCAPGCALTAELRASHATVGLAGLAFVATDARVALAGRLTGAQLVIDSSVVVAAPTATIARGDSVLALTGATLTVRDGSEPSLVASRGDAWPTELRWRADAGDLGGLHLAAPSGVASRAPAGVHTIAWRALAGPWSVRGDDGDLALQVVDGKARVVAGHLHALAGELVVVPALGEDVLVHARGLALGRLLAAVGDGHLAGTGLVDGELAIALDGTLVSAQLRTRADGVLRVTDAAWRAAAAAPITGVMLQQRIQGALADLAYTRLVATLAPPGVRPELHVSLQGQGAQALHQALDVDLNVNGARDAVHGFLHRDDQELP